MGIIKTVDGLAWASVKTMQGLAVASVKTIQGADSVTAGSAAPTFVAEYPTNFSTAGTEKTAMSAVAINSGDVLVACLIRADTGGALSFWENGSATQVALQSYTNTGFCPTSAVGYTAGTNETITATIDNDLYCAYGGNVLRFSDSSGIGASNKAQGTSGYPSVNLTTTKANSAVVVIVSDWLAAIGTQTWSSTPGIPTNKTGYVGDGQNYGVAIAYYADVGAIGEKTFAMTEPSGQKWNIIAVEIKGPV